MKTGDKITHEGKQYTIAEIKLVGKPWQDLRTMLMLDDADGNPALALGLLRFNYSRNPNLERRYITH